jgi:hypothetical protein
MNNRKLLALFAPQQLPIEAPLRRENKISELMKDAESKSNNQSSYVERIKAIATSFGHNTGDMKPFFEINKDQLHRIKVKKVTNKSGTFRAHPRGGE